MVQLLQVFLLEYHNAAAYHKIVELLILARLQDFVLVFVCLVPVVLLLVPPDATRRLVEQRKQQGYVYTE